MTETTQAKGFNKGQLLILLLLNYFTFMLITTIIGVLLGAWKEDFQLSGKVVAYLGSAFFIAYGLTSLPLGIVSERLGSKKTFLMACALICLGSLIFAIFPSFKVGLVSLFVIGAGVTALQIVGNLLVKRIDEDLKNYSRNLTLAQVFCGVGAFSGGVLNAALTKTFPEFHWTWFYFLFAILIGVLGVLAAFTNIPENQEKEASGKEPAAEDYLKLLANPMMLLFAGGIFIYVGIEVGVANSIVNFMEAQHGWIGKKALASAGLIVSAYWILQAVGRLTGGIVLNFLNSAKALILYAIGAGCSVLLAVNLPENVAGYAFMAAGFFTSIMFPTIFSMAVNFFDKKQEDTVAGVLCTAIFGGAVVHPLIETLGEAQGLRTSLMIIGALCYLYIALIGVLNLKHVAKASEQADAA